MAHPKIEASVTRKPRTAPTARTSPNIRTAALARTAKKSGALAASLALMGGLGTITVASTAPTAVAQSSLVSSGLFPTNPVTNGPTLDLSADRDLTNDQTITVKGSGYRAGEKIYVTQTIAKPASGYPSTYADAKKVTVAPDGTFETDLTVTTSFSGVDCTTQECFIASFTAFPKLYDRSQDSWSPISFAGAGTSNPANPSGPSTPPPTSDTPSAPTSNGPTVILSKTSGLNPDGDTIRVTGRGFKTTGNGIYVGIAQNDQFSTTNADVFGPDTVWVSKHKGNLNDDGTFTIDLPVSARFADANCLENQCSVFTFAAHGSSDRSQDTSTPVRFTSPNSGSNSGGGSGSDPKKPGGNSGARPGGGNTGGTNNSGNTGGGNTGVKPPAVNVTGARSSSGASVSLSKTTNLNPAGDTIRVTGRGFKTSGNGIYVGIAQQNQYNTTNADTFGPGTVWVSKRKGNLNPDGSFSINLPVSAKFGSANCMVNQCSVYTLAAHGSSDRSQDTAVPVSFAGGVGPSSASEAAASQARGGAGNSGGAGGAGASGGSGSGMGGPRSLGSAGSGSAGGSGSGSAASGGGASSAEGLGSTSSSGASVTLSTTSIAPTGTTPITVTGEGFTTSGNGIYVAIAEKSKFSTTDADAFGAALWVKTSDMTSSGGFSTTLDVEAVFPAGNCIENQCAVFTFAAHGSSDRSQDTATDITVSGTEEEKRKASEEAKKKQQKARKAAEEAAKKAKARNNRGGSDDAEVDTVASSSSQPGWPFGLALGVLGTLAAVFGTMLFQEKRKNRAGAGAGEDSEPYGDDE